MVDMVSFCSLQTHLITDPSPLALSKAIKNEVEIEGMKQAHVSKTYALLTKREVKMAAYWPNSFFFSAFLSTKTKSRLIKTQKRTRPS